MTAVAAALLAVGAAAGIVAWRLSVPNRVMAEIQSLELQGGDGSIKRRRGKGRPAATTSP